MAFVDMGVFARLDLAVFVETDVFAGQEVSWAECGGDATGGDHHIQACRRSSDEADEHPCWDALEGHSVEFAADALLCCTDGSFDGFGVFIFGCDVEWNTCGKRLYLKRLELSVGSHLADHETSVVVGYANRHKACEEGRHCCVSNVLRGPVLEIGRDRMEETQSVDEEHVRFNDHMFVVFEDGGGHGVNVGQRWGSFVVCRLAHKVRNAGAVYGFGDFCGPTGDWVVTDRAIVDLIEHAAQAESH